MNRSFRLKTYASSQEEQFIELGIMNCKTILELPIKTGYVLSPASMDFLYLTKLLSFHSSFETNVPHLLRDCQVYWAVL